MSSDTIIYTILGIIVCLAITLPFIIQAALENKDRFIPRKKSKGAFRQFPLNDE